MVAAAPVRPTYIDYMETVIETSFNHPILSIWAVCAAYMTETGAGLISTSTGGLLGAFTGMYGGFYVGFFIQPFFSTESKNVMFYSLTRHIGPALGAMAGVGYVVSILPRSQFIGTAIAGTGITGLSSYLFYKGLCNTQSL